MKPKLLRQNVQEIGGICELKVQKFNPLSAFKWVVSDYVLDINFKLLETFRVSNSWFGQSVPKSTRKVVLVSLKCNDMNGIRLSD